MLEIKSCKINHRPCQKSKSNGKSMPGYIIYGSFLVNEPELKRGP